jgi:hypothetical protein
MSSLNFTRYLLECDGCKQRHGEPNGHNSAREARLAAYVDGWRYPPMVKTDGSHGTSTSDVCPDCFPAWTLRGWGQRQGSGRRLSTDEAPATGSAS